MKGYGKIVSSPIFYYSLTYFNHHNNDAVQLCYFDFYGFHFWLYRRII